MLTRCSLMQKRLRREQAGQPRRQPRRKTILRSELQVEEGRPRHLRLRSDIPTFLPFALDHGCRWLRWAWLVIHPSRGGVSCSPRFVVVVVVVLLFVEDGMPFSLSLFLFHRYVALQYSGIFFFL